MQLLENYGGKDERVSYQRGPLTGHAEENGGMKFVWIGGAMLGLLSISACGSKQSSGVADESSRAIAVTYNGDTAAAREIDGVLRARNLVNTGQNAFYEREPVISFRVNKETNLEITAGSDAADLLMLIVGPGLPYSDDDTYGLNPSIRTQFTPGVYHVYVGVWSGSSSDVPFKLSLRDPSDESPDFVQESFGERRAVPARRGEPNLSAASALPTLTLKDSDASEQHSAVLTPLLSPDDCQGFYDFSQPLIEIDPRELGQGGARLVLSGEADGSTVDTMLYGVAADGSIVCNDDFDGLNAGLELVGGDNAPIKIFAGLWDGSLLGGEVTFTLSATTMSAQSFKIETIQSRFQGEPLHVAIKGRNRHSLEPMGAGCVGYVRDLETPDWKVNVTQRGLALDFRAQGGQDPVMAVRTPSGEVFCNDDAEGLNSSVLIAEAATGEYQVWGGSWNPGQPTSSVLSVRGVTPLTTRGVRPVGVENFGEHSLTVTPRKPVSVLGNPQLCNGGAVGHMDLDSPSAAFENTTSGSLYLLVRTTADFDTSMVARGTGGFMECTDDDVALDALSIVPLAPGEKAYVWVGSFDQANAGKRITLRYAFVEEDSARDESLIQSFFE